MNRFRLALLALGVGALLALPVIINAQANVGAGADAMCNATCAQLAQLAAQQHNPALNCTPAGGTVVPCGATPPGGSVQGQCMLGLGCKSNSASGLNGGNAQSTLGQLGQLIGQILSKLGQSSGSGSGSSPTTAPTTGCTSSYYYTSNSSLIGVDPCALYQAAPTCTDTTATNFGASAACTYGPGTTTCSDPTATNFGAAAACTYGTNPGTTTPGTTTDTLTATPASGSAPLAVTFSTIPKATDLSPFTINFGDGSSPQSLAETACTAGAGSCTFQANYTYTTAGTFNATVLDANSNTLSGATVTVTNPNGTTPGSSLLTQVLQNLGGLLAATTTPLLPGGTGETSPNFPGVFGNILLDQNGATIFASTVNSANNSETSAFFGSDTLGAQPQGVASQLCQNRPWASNFLADIIPPLFFDSLCQWGGFQVGQLPQQTAPASTQPQVTLSQQAQTKQTTAAVQTQSTTTITTPAQATIWAVPSSVPLGARTSIFWNTQGVTQCTETSPNGSFSENSLSGAAATVPITGPTTFTISCLDPNGDPVTNYVTVEVSG